MTDSQCRGGDCPGATLVRIDELTLRCPECNRGYSSPTDELREQNAKP